MPEVSIITPCYNSEKYLDETIKSVLNQTFTDWEWIIVDDCSKDNSTQIIKKHIDPRIKLIENKKNLGVAESRNQGIKNASGNIIAFLDSDDLWAKNKLEEQIKLHKLEKYAIVFSNYDNVNENGTSLGREVKSPEIVDYEQLLKSNYIGCLTASYNVSILGEKQYMKKIGHEDYVLWLSILKKGHKAINTNSCLAFRRVVKTSLSSNKLKAASWQWNIYRNVEKLSFLRSLYYFCFYITNAIKKY